MPKYPVIFFLLAMPLPALAAPGEAPQSSLPTEMERIAPAASAMPENVRAMLTTAIRSGNESDIRSVAKVAKTMNSEWAAEVDTLVTAHFERRTEDRQATIRQAGFFDLWSGRGELGGFRSTGTASEVGISASLNLKRAGLKWTHLLRANSDYRRANGTTSREYFLAGYEPRYQMNTRTFVYGLGQYERDPFLGFDNRFTASLGVGNQFIKSDKVSLSVNAGPSFRQIDYVDGAVDSSIGLRTSVDFNWKLTPTLTFHQDASAYLEQDAASASGLAALDAKVFSSLSARFSYNVRYESETPLTTETLDTTSRVTLIYDF